jgi:LmbE family N-acetylglucosaminyl deacetylase
MTINRRPSLLVVYAHPDDELFHGGMLAHLADRGVRVTLVSATPGDAGKVHPSLGRVDDVGAVRTAELHRSCERLGIEPPIVLDFHDSARKERQRHDDPRALANVDMLEVETAIRNIIRDVEPHVVLTFEPHGGYYHPDHVAVHRATTAAFFSSGVMGAAAPMRLFYGGLLVDTVRVLAERTRGRGIVDGLDPEVFGTAPGMVAVSFDARPYLDRKFAALAAHQSAFGVTDGMLADPPPGVAPMLDAFRPIFEHEVFVLAGTRGPVRRWPLHDLFDGLDFSGAGASSDADATGAAALSR